MDAVGGARGGGDVGLPAGAHRRLCQSAAARQTRRPIHRRVGHAAQWHRVRADRDLLDRRGDLAPLVHRHHKCLELARQHGWGGYRRGGDCGRIHGRTLRDRGANESRDVRRSALRVLARFPGPQLSASPYLHGRFGFLVHRDGVVRARASPRARRIEKSGRRHGSSCADSGRADSRYDDRPVARGPPGERGRPGPYLASLRRHRSA